MRESSSKLLAKFNDQLTILEAERDDLESMINRFTDWVAKTYDSYERGSPQWCFWFAVESVFQSITCYESDPDETAEKYKLLWGYEIDWTDAYISEVIGQEVHHEEGRREGDDTNGGTSSGTDGA